MRLIDADVLKQGVNGVSTHWLNEWSTLGVLAMVDKQTTVDAVPVVRCKDCRHRDPEDHKCDCGEMERQGCPFRVDDDYYCAYGERKGGAEDAAD